MAHNQSSRHLRNLRGRSFKGQDLTGADFSYSDIRGADFTNATLIGANFSHCLAGLPPNRAIALIALSFLYLGVSGSLFSILSFPSDTPISNLDPEFIKHYIAAPSVFIFFVALEIFFTIHRRERLTAALVTGAVAVVSAAVVASAAVMAPGIAVAVTAGVALVLVGVLLGTLDGLGCLLMLGFAVLAIPFTKNFYLFGYFLWVNIASQLAFNGALALKLAVNGALPFGLAWTLAGACTLGLAVASSGGNIDRHGALFWAVQLAVTIAAVVAAALLGAYLASKRPACVKGSTSFRGANLTNATFTQATLKNTDFRKAILIDTDFANCHQLNDALLDKNSLGWATSQNQVGFSIWLSLLLSLFLVFLVDSGNRGFERYFQGDFPSHPTEKIRRYKLLLM
jgi:hypothetical protein